MHNRKGFIPILILAVAVLLAIFAYLGYNYVWLGKTNIESDSSKSKLALIKLSCEKNSGKWLDEYKECERISPEWCSQNKGEFFGCASACRHNPSAGACIMVCVQICKFK